MLLITIYCNKMLLLFISSRLVHVQLIRRCYKWERTDNAVLIAGLQYLHIV